MSNPRDIREQVYRSQPYKLKSSELARQFRLTFDLPEFQAALDSRNLMGGFFIDRSELFRHLARPFGPHYLRKGNPHVAFRVRRCHIDDDNMITIDYSVEGPRARQMNLALIGHMCSGGLPIRLSSISMVPKSEFIDPKSVVSIIGFFYIHKRPTR